MPIKIKIIASLLGGIIFLIVVALFIYERGRANELEEKYKSASVKVQMKQNIIDQYDNDRKYMDALLVERANNASIKEKKLNEQIAKLKSDLSGVHCDIPQSVTDELRRTY